VRDGWDEIGQIGGVQKWEIQIYVRNREFVEEN